MNLSNDKGETFDLLDVAAEKGQENIKPEHYHICTIVGSEYAFKVVTLYQSLMRHTKCFRLWVCCIDDASYNLFHQLKLPNLNVLSIVSFKHEQLDELRKERTDAELCWTLKSVLVTYLLNEQQLESVLYCDGDIYFFEDVKEIFKDWGKSSIYLCPQRDYEWVEKTHGKFQAGIIGFRRDKNGLAGLKWWKEQCLQWCFARVEKGKFGDQKYLDEVATCFQNVKVSKHVGIDAAPWNCLYGENNFHIYVKEGHVYINDSPLVAFHFAKISVFSESDYDLWSLSQRQIQGVILHHIYIPYLTSLREAMFKVKKVNQSVWYSGLTRYLGNNQVKNYFKYEQDGSMHNFSGSGGKQ